MSHDSPIADCTDLEGRRDALRSKLDRLLSSNEQAVWKRLINSGRRAEAASLVAQAESFFLTASVVIECMNEEELRLFEEAVTRGDKRTQHRAVATTIMRIERERLSWRVGASSM